MLFCKIETRVSVSMVTAFTLPLTSPESWAVMTSLRNVGAAFMIPSLFAASRKLYVASSVPDPLSGFRMPEMILTESPIAFARHDIFAAVSTDEEPVELVELAACVASAVSARTELVILLIVPDMILSFFKQGTICRPFIYFVGRIEEKLNFFSCFSNAFTAI
jgi:hypothetical protein